MEKIREQTTEIENSRVRDWIGAGGKALGYACIATPVEVISAAGVLPYRVRALGSAETEMADAHLSRFNCSFCRSVLQLALDGSLDFLGGMVETNGCDHLRGMVENWRHAKGIDFFHYLRVPHIVEPDAMEFFVDEIKLMRDALSEFSGNEVTDDALWEEIGRHGRIRDKLKRVYALREREAPAISGAEALEVYLAGSASPPDLFEEDLDRLLDGREDHKIEGHRARLLLGGSATDEIDFVREIEDVGGLVVTDVLCFGARAFWPRTADRHHTPEETLAHMYLENLICPRMFDEFAKRREFVFRAADRAKVDGAIFVHNKFCDIHGVDNVQLRLALEERGIPVLQLEKEYGAKADLGRMRTRVQAFLERIGGSK